MRNLRSLGGLYSLAFSGPFDLGLVDIQANTITSQIMKMIKKTGWLGAWWWLCRWRWRGWWWMWWLWMWWWWLYWWWWWREWRWQWGWGGIIWQRTLTWRNPESSDGSWELWAGIFSICIFAIVIILIIMIIINLIIIIMVWWLFWS